MISLIGLKLSNLEFVDLDDKEVVIQHDSEPSELLYRQMCEHIWDSQYQRPNVDSFGPQRVDQRKPSFARGSIVSAQDSRDWHNENARSKSIGVWACSIAEVHEAGTRGIDDSACPEDPDQKRSPGHAYVDYRHVDRGGMRVIKASLLMAAIRRGEVPTN